MNEISELQGLLADLRADLRRGRYERLREVLPVLETTLSGPLAMDAAAIEQLKAEARRSSRAARAALRGVQTGQRRVAELMRIDAGFLSYDADGASETAPRAPMFRRKL